MSEEDAGPRKFGQRPGRPAPRAPGPQPESPSESGSNQNDAVQPAPATVTSTNATTEGVSSSSNAPFSSPPLRSASGTDISSAPDNNSNHRRVRIPCRLLWADTCPNRGLQNLASVVTRLLMSALSSYSLDLILTPHLLTDF